MGRCLVARYRRFHMPMVEEPYHVVDLSHTTRHRTVQEIVCWLSGDDKLNDYDQYKTQPPTACILNVAGARESLAPGIHDAVFASWWRS